MREGCGPVDLAAAGPDGLSLKVEDDEARAGSIWDAHRHRTLPWNGPQARLDDQRYPVGLDFPMCIVGKFAVRKRGLRPTGVDKANFAFLSSHVGRSRVQDPSIHFAPKQYLLTVFGKQLMDFAHVPVCLSDLGNLGHLIAALSPWTLPGLLRSIRTLLVTR